MVDSPAQELREPTPSDPIPDLVENIIGAPQYISPSYWIGWAAEQVTGTNPWQWIADQYAGDWKAVQSAGIALENLSEFNASYAGTVKSSMEAALHDWSGNAADGAKAYFADLTGKVDGQVADLAGMGTQFKQTAIGIYETSNAIKGLWETLLDLLIAIGLEAAAAAASSWTVIGPILSGAAAAVTITKAIGVWGQIIEMHNHAWNAVQGLIGVIGGYLGALHDLERQALPAGNYDHPAVQA